ncbi:MAG: hypothetical protein OXC19_14715 [Bryobacterales bacterium]|nr:hypothetical protein [Bryobacterales bacterium]
MLWSVATEAWSTEVASRDPLALTHLRHSDLGTIDSKKSYKLRATLWSNTLRALQAAGIRVHRRPQPARVDAGLHSPSGSSSCRNVALALQDPAGRAVGLDTEHVALDLQLKRSKTPSFDQRFIRVAMVR